MHIGSPKIKSFSSKATSEKGIHNTDSNKSLIDRFSKNKLVIVRIFLILVNVSITSMFPDKESRKMMEYNTIIASALKNSLLAKLPVWFTVVFGPCIELFDIKVDLSGVTVDIFIP